MDSATRSNSSIKWLITRTMDHADKYVFNSVLIRLDCYFVRDRSRSLNSQGKLRFWFLNNRGIQGGFFATAKKKQQHAIESRVFNATFHHRMHATFERILLFFLNRHRSVNGSVRQNMVQFCTPRLLHFWTTKVVGLYSKLKGNGCALVAILEGEEGE